MHEWLPRLVGIEHHVAFVLADGSEVRSIPEAGHASQLTRASVTSAVHYLQFPFSEHQIEALASGSARLVVDHPAYRETMHLSIETIRELLGDLRPDRF